MAKLKKDKKAKKRSVFVCFRTNSDWTFGGVSKIVRTRRAAEAWRNQTTVLGLDLGNDYQEVPFV